MTARPKSKTVPTDASILAVLRSVEHRLITARVAQLANACVLQTREVLLRLERDGLAVNEGSDVCGLWRAVPTANSHAPKH